MSWTLLVLLVAIGTYLMRLLPLWVTLGANPARTSGNKAFSRALALAAPAIIAALLVASVVPAKPDATVSEMARRLVGLLVAAVAFRWRPNLAMAVFVGVAVYAVLSLL